MPPILGDNILVSREADARRIDQHLCTISLSLSTAGPPVDDVEDETGYRAPSTKQQQHRQMLAGQYALP